MLLHTGCSVNLMLLCLHYEQAAQHPSK